MKKLNDRIIEDGFPDGWFVQDRLDENTALLIHKTPGMWPGSACICLRPKAMRTEEWLPTARTIAFAMSGKHALPPTGRRVNAALSVFKAGDMGWDEQDEELMRQALIAADRML